MQYTLDSVVQLEESLKREFPGFAIDRIPVVKAGDQLNGMVENPQIVYFGVLTTNDTNQAKLSYRGNEVLTMDSGSQAIVCFTKAEFLTEANEPVENPKGLFRGFEIQVQS
jgi:hypothetical protein